MGFIFKSNVHNLYNFIFLCILTDFLTVNIQCLRSPKFELSERFNFKLSLVQFISLIDVYKPTDIGSGTPNMLPPPFLRDALSNITSSMDASVHQYLPPEGSIELRTEIASLYSPLIKRTLNPTENVVVTLGTSEGLYLALLVHTSPGDEWIVIEPAFENYYSVIKATGGTVRPVKLVPRTKGTLGSGDMVLDKADLKKAFNARTKGIILNNPHNPTGKVFTTNELMLIAKLAIKWNTLIISDEVYEWMIFDSKYKHIRLASLGDEVFSRTITLSSISKAYYATGWRVGWAFGPSNLIANVIAPQSGIAYTLNTHTQLAAAIGLRKMRNELGQPNSYFNKLTKSLEQKRNFMVKWFNMIGMQIIIPQSGYYVYANYTNLISRSTDLNKEEGSFMDIKFIKWLIKNARILATPGTAFYHTVNKKFGENFIRFCFAKKDETLVKGAMSLLQTFSL